MQTRCAALRDQYNGSRAGRCAAGEGDNKSRETHP